MASMNKADLEAVELTLQQFRVNELHILLSTFRCPKLGKKNELIQRCVSLLQNSRNQAAVMQKIREISASRRYHALGTQSSGHSHYGQDGGSLLTGAHSMYAPQVPMPPNMLHHPFLPSQHSFASLMDRARNLRIVDLPFYDKTQTLLELSELPASASGIRTTSRTAFNFFIAPDVLCSIAYRNEPVVLPRVEVQMRFFLLDHTKEQADDFPPNCEVKIDNTCVALPNVIPTNKPNVEPKRPSRPVNITPFVQHPREPDNAHKVLVEWTADRRAWAVGIFVVTRLTSDILMRRLLTNVHARRDVFVTKRAIKLHLTDDEDDSVQMESVKFTLLCPLGRTRMVTPVKGSDCAHLQCFDLLLFLKMNEKRPTWKCAICDKAVPYNKLIIDGYFEQVLKKAGPNVTEIELLRDGDWRPVVSQEESASDDDEVPAKKSCSVPPNSHRLPMVASAPTLSISAPIPDDDVIVLGDSDDEVEEVSSSTNRHESAARNSPSHSASNQSVICIDLDDSDPIDLTGQLCAQSQARGRSPITASRLSPVSQAASSSSVVPSHTPPHIPSQFLSWYTPPPPPPAPVQNSGVPFLNGFDTPYSVFPDPYNNTLIAEELRQFMASIHQATRTSSRRFS
ncbi:E3 SUMO-protein ligase gei-17 [Toxocara canis]|uniref:E3 SUMO-protein ligase gei-17 n=1 Tax=Toxocara canis TaxID=6265 RepID=A0A0B2W4N6_TOXCA|nr:E3 SUMO-protein ligase gei-17 [Toxocara canis]